MVEFAGGSPGLFQPGACDPRDRTVPQVGESTRMDAESGPNRPAPKRARLRALPSEWEANRVLVDPDAPQPTDPELYERWVARNPGAAASAVRAEELEREREARKQKRQSKPYTIYKLFDADDALLYVGISVTGLGRLAQHAAGKSWWPHVTHAEFEHVDGEEAARARELELIRRRVWRNDWRNARALGDACDVSQFERLFDGVEHHCGYDREAAELTQECLNPALIGLSFDRLRQFLQGAVKVRECLAGGRIHTGRVDVSGARGGHETGRLRAGTAALSSHDHSCACVRDAHACSGDGHGEVELPWIASYRLRDCIDELGRLGRCHGTPPARISEVSREAAA